MKKVMSFRSRRKVSIFAGVALAALLTACGSDTGVRPSPPPPPPPPPPAPVVVGQGGGSLEAGFVGRGAAVTTTRPGTLDATVDWTFATNDVDAIIVRGDCSFDQFEAEQCPILAVAAGTAKPEKLTVSGAAVGTYTLFIENTGPTDESVTYQIVLTASASSVSVANPSGLVLPEKLRRFRGRVELH